MNEFKDCLNEAEKRIAIPWERYISIAQWCIETLTKDTFINNFRKDKDNKLNRLSTAQIDLYFECTIGAWSNGDPFYYPGYFCDKDGNTTTYTNEHALSDIRKIISPDFILSEDPLCENDTYFYIMALKKAFHVMSTMKNPPLKAALHLAEILGEIYKQVADFHNEIQQKEYIRGQNQRNSAGVARTLDFIENHPLYNKIESLIERLKPDQEGKERNEIYAEMINIIRQLIDNGKRGYRKHDDKTIRRYRDYILSISYKYYLLDKETVNKNRIKYGLEIYYGQKGALSIAQK